MSNDPWEQLLVIEAIMERFTAMRRVQEHEHDARAEAKRKADELRDTYRGTSRRGAEE